MESGQELDWKNLGFGYHPTDYNVRLSLIHIYAADEAPHV